MREPRIWILEQEVAERIAAGEVVERPASVVKELVENALDAGARRITVETEAGGKRLLRVTDDGGGMTAEEAHLALQRHATSKLRTAGDLFNILTLGFRGEALPSIAAVSEMEILTRPADSPEGARLRVLGGVLQAREPAAAQVGTVMTVRRLFFNVPVREKFLRSDTAEANQITEWLQRLALSHPSVSFRLVHDGREALLSPGSRDPLNAVVAILGRPVARELIRLPEPPPAPDTPPAPSLTGFPPAPPAPDPWPPTPSVTGFVGRPTLTRANRSLQHTYVNGRAVRSPLFYRALDDAYRATMPQGRYPAALLFVQVPPDTVDVNVHPAKVEVRFLDEPAVYNAVVRQVRAALHSAAGDAAGLEAALDLDTPAEYARPPLHEPGRIAEPAVPPPTAPPPNPASLPFADRAIGGAAGPERWGSPGAPGNRRPWEARPTPPPLLPGTDPFASVETPVPSPPPQPGQAPERSAIGELRLLGQAQDLFILAFGEGRLWVIDQHVAHERILFDLMTAEHAAGPGEPLLIPAAVDVNRAQALALDEHRELLAQMGFTVEPFGPNGYSLRSVPRGLVGENYERVFRDLVEELAEQSHGGQARLRKDQLAAAAAGRSCKRAVKAGQTLSEGEMQRLLDGLRSARNPYTCPHGRPVFVTYSQAEVERMFGAPGCR